MAVVGFFPLGLPTSDHHTGEIDWCMRNEGPEPYYLLSHTPHVGDLGDYPDGDFYFALESSCHAHGAGYYMNHGKKYPYQDEWQAACIRETGGLDDDDDDDLLESQVMEFE